MNSKRHFYLCLWAALILSLSFESCSSRSGNTSSIDSQLRTGDLIFVSDTSGIGNAISASTGVYTHVAIVLRRSDGCYVYESLPSEGVIVSPLSQWIDRQDTAILRFNHDFIVFARPKSKLDTLLLVANLKYHLGQPYDPYFAIHNGRSYCSELVEDCFYDVSGRKLFHTQPMNFLDSSGNLPDSWQIWFDSLGVPVPQGEPGTNPTDLLHSPELQRLDVSIGE